MMAATVWWLFLNFGLLFMTFAAWMVWTYEAKPRLLGTALHTIVAYMTTTLIILLSLGVIEHLVPASERYDATVRAATGVAVLFVCIGVVSTLVWMGILLVTSKSVLDEPFTDALEPPLNTIP